MQPRLIGELVNAAIPILGGVYVTLLGHRVVGKKPGLSLKYDDWFSRNGHHMKKWGPILVLLGLIVGVVNLNREVNSPPSADASTNPWTRYTTSDSVCSAEFPGLPTQDTKANFGVMAYRLTFAPLDAYYTLTYSDLPNDGVTATDEERLNLFRDNIPKLGAAQGIEYTIVHENKVAVNGVNGRDLEFSSRGTHVMRMQIFLLHGQVYRTVIVLPIAENGSETMRHFLGSFRFEKIDGHAPISQ